MGQDPWFGPALVPQVALWQSTDSASVPSWLSQPEMGPLSRAVGEKWGRRAGREEGALSDKWSQMTVARSCRRLHDRGRQLRPLPGSTPRGPRPGGGLRQPEVSQGGCRGTGKGVARRGGGRPGLPASLRSRGCKGASEGQDSRALSTSDHHALLLGAFSRLQLLSGWHPWGPCLRPWMSSKLSLDERLPHAPLEPWWPLDGHRSPGGCPARLTRRPFRLGTATAHLLVSPSTQAPSLQGTSVPTQLLQPKAQSPP